MMKKQKLENYQMVGVDAAKSKEEKMKIIFDKFDVNKDSHLGITELLGWIMAVEPTLSNDLQRLPFLLQIYLGNPSFLAGSKGLSYSGFTNIYEEGHRNIDHDFNTINIQPPIHQGYVVRGILQQQQQRSLMLQSQLQQQQQYQQQEQHRSWMLQSQLVQQQAQQRASLATNTFSNNHRNTTQQVGGGISSAGPVSNIGITAQQMGRVISSAVQVNSYGNTMQQVGGNLNSADEVNKNVNPAEQENAVKDVKSKVKYDGSHPKLAARLEKEILDTNPGVKWDDVAGLSEAKRILQETVVLPLFMPEYFQGIRRPSRGVLMFGPPGTGKTLLAKAVATECGMTFMNISCSSLCGNWYGESERLTRCLFELARAHAPTMIFIDEIDSLCSVRGSATKHETSRRLKSELLVQIDGLNNSNSTSGKMVTLLAATNFPGNLDEALRRRLEKRIYIPLPDFETRKELIQINLKLIELAPEVDIEQVAQKTEGYSGDDLTNICRDASLNGMRQKIAGKTIDESKNILKSEILKIPVTMEDFLEAVDKIKPTVSSGDIQRHQKWYSEFGSS
ncbi:katanin p60 ATPase-containing subunit A1-like isoform X1 [Solanum lycopersicum]|uniref:katanin p60 ATPase-containing subunit A1-like isoform X1 n=1 Tax=Solanum lycopersicum TaxID=4081 RepID=UPI000E1C84BF|nr:katanin p60 ATPase-containing subunit A1-like isoform X1 [Solanum lycopersicum]